MSILFTFVCNNMALAMKKASEENETNIRKNN